MLATPFAPWVCLCQLSHSIILSSLFEIEPKTLDVVTHSVQKGRYLTAPLGGFCSQKKQVLSVLRSCQGMAAFIGAGPGCCNAMWC